MFVRFRTLARAVSLGINKPLRTPVARVHAMAAGPKHPDQVDFAELVPRLLRECEANRSGAKATYIPQLAHVRRAGCFIARPRAPAPSRGEGIPCGGRPAVAGGVCGLAGAGGRARKLASAYLSMGNYRSTRSSLA